MGSCCSVITSKSGIEPEELIDNDEKTPKRSSLKPSKASSNSPEKLEGNEEQGKEVNNEGNSILISVTNPSGIIDPKLVNSIPIEVEDVNLDVEPREITNSSKLKRGKTFSESPIRQVTEESLEFIQLQTLNRRPKRGTAQFGYLEGELEDQTDNFSHKPKPLLKRSATSTFYDDDRRRERRKKKVKFKDLEIMKSAKRQKSLSSKKM